MAYSNTNKDNIQVKLGRFLAVAVALFFAFSSIKSAWKQYSLLRTAENKYMEISDNIIILEQDILKLEEQIKYATSSTGLKRNQIRYYGMGTADDYWLKVPKDELERVKIAEETIVGRGVDGNIQKWWQLFTK